MTPKSISDDAEYYRARALQEQDAAAKAETPCARSCHDKLAMMYRFRAAMLSSGPDTNGDSFADEPQSEPA